MWENIKNILIKQIKVYKKIKVKFYINRGSFLIAIVLE